MILAGTVNHDAYLFNLGFDSMIVLGNIELDAATPISVETCTHS
jgi:hypothetical protein